MRSSARLRFRLASLLVLALSIAGIAAGIAFARSSAAPKPAPNAGIVIIETNLAYQGAEAAGTGMVLTSNGEVLTNNHVIRGATTIKVLVPTTNRSYTATVAGYSVVNDTALLKLQGASKLATVTLGDSAKLKLGQAVRAVGNAGGTGELTTSTGKITGLDKAISVSDDQGGSARLTSLIETSAALQPGDSGGPLFDSGGRVIGMDTAASLSGGFRFSAPTNDSYAIPIKRALGVVKSIHLGTTTTTVHVGGTSFLGVSVASQSDFFGNGSNGAFVQDIVPNSPADQAGLERGDQITAINGTAVTSPTTIVTTLLGLKPGTQITLAIVDSFGQQHTLDVTLASGPPQ